MIEIPKELLDNIQEAIRQRFRRGENGWEHGEHEEGYTSRGLFRQPAFGERASNNNWQTI